MKKKLFFCLFVAALSSTMFAQSSQIKDCPVFGGYRSLILDWNDSLTIAYTEDVINHQGYFLAEILLPYISGRYIQLPNRICANDIDFDSEKLLFGGTLDSGGAKYGTLGRIHTPNSFTWGQNMEHIVFNWINQGTTDVLITDIKRIVHILEPNTNLDYFRIACIADCLVANKTDTIETTAICDVLYNYASWKVYIYINNDQTINYTDITLTDNLVAAVGTNTSTNNTYISLFNRPYPFVNNLLVPATGFEITNELSGEKALADAIENDLFAIASHYSTTSEAGHSIKLIDCNSGYPVIAAASYMIQNNSPIIDKNWQLKELKYDPLYKLLYLLQDMDQPVSTATKSVVCEYDFPNFAAGTALSSWINGDKTNGLGLWWSGGFQTAGSTSGTMRTYKKRGWFMPTNCADYMELEYYLAGPKLMPTVEKALVVTKIYQSVSTPLSPSNAIINFNCNE